MKFWTDGRTGLYCKRKCALDGGARMQHLVEYDSGTFEEDTIGDDDLWYESDDGHLAPMFGACCQHCEELILD